MWVSFLLPFGMRYPVVTPSMGHRVSSRARCLKMYMAMEKQWNTGKPPRKGWYQCRIDGIEIKLYCFICELNPRKWYWVDETQARISDEVEWLG